MKKIFFEDSLKTSVSQLSIKRQEQDEIRNPPQKIRQNKFTKTYSKLEHIPLQRHIETLHPKSIEHLYISHNKIKSLSGIEEFQNLISLNVSYNMLTKIQELSLIQKPQNILRIGLKMNDFVYGYEDYAVYFFKYLHKLDDIDVKDKSKVKKLQEQGERVANLFLEFHIRVSRIFLFLDDLIKQEKVHQQMSLTRSLSNKRNPKLKLLFEHMTESFIAKISSIYVMPTQQEFLQLPTTQILNRIEQAINFTLQEDIDLKCTCRPQKSYQQEVKDSFKEICFNFLARFASRYNNELKNGLKKMNKKFNSKIQDRKLQQWQLWGMLENYLTLASGGKNYQHLTSTIGNTYVQFETPHEYNFSTKSRKSITQQNQWRNKVFISQQNLQSDKQNFTPNVPYQYQQKRNTNSQNHQLQRIQLFYNRIPIVLYEKNYVEILLQITMEIIRSMLEKYDYLNKVRTKYFVNLQKQKNENEKRMSLHEIYAFTSEKKTKAFKSKSQRISNEQKYIKQSNERESSMKETKRAETQRNEDDYLTNLQDQIFFKKTIVQNSPSPSDQVDQLSSRTTQRRFLNRQQSQISFGIIKERDEDFSIEDQQGIQWEKVKQNIEDSIKGKDYSMYEINLIYKVFRAFKIKVIKGKNKRKAQINRI